jgi:hypothetical protein
MTGTEFFCRNSKYEILLTRKVWTAREGKLAITHQYVRKIMGQVRMTENTVSILCYCDLLFSYLQLD